MDERFSFSSSVIATAAMGVFFSNHNNVYIPLLQPINLPLVSTKMDSEASLQFLQRYQKIGHAWHKSIPFNDLEIVNCYMKSFELQFVDKTMQILYRPLNKMDDGFFDNGHSVQIFLALQSWYFDNRIERRRTNMTIAMMKTYKTYLNHYNLLELFKAFVNTEELVMLPTFNKETFLKKVVDLYSTQKPTGANVHQTYKLLNEELNAMHNIYTLHIMKHVAKLIYAFMELCEGENFYTILNMDQRLRSENERLVESTYIFRAKLLHARTQLEKAGEYLFQ